MSRRSIRSVMLKEVILVMILSAMVIAVLTVWLEIKGRREEKSVRLQNFESALLRDQDGLLLQILLAKAHDLNFYFSNLKAKFPAVNFCLDFAPMISGFPSNVRNLKCRKIAIMSAAISPRIEIGELSAKKLDSTMDSSLMS